MHKQTKKTVKLVAPLCVALLILAFAPAGGAVGADGDAKAATYYPVSSSTRYLAEGCTRAGFETWLTVANLYDGSRPDGHYGPWPPESEQFWKLTVAYTTNDGVVATKSYDLPKLSRTTINVNAEIGAGYDVAFELTMETNAGGPGGIWIERPMYFSYTGRGGHVLWQGGHVNSSSVLPIVTDDPYPSIRPARQYFAEGTTRGGFEEWICVLNPNDTPAQLTFNYMIQGEGLVVRTGTVPAKHRSTWYVADHVGVGKDVSLELVPDVPVIAERPMYFGYMSRNSLRPGREWYGGHVITGVSETKLRVSKDPTTLPTPIPPRTFAFAPVAYVPGMGWADTWVCFQNPNETDVPVQLTFSTPAGLAYFTKWLPAQQRSTFYYPELLAEYGVTSSRDPGAFRVEPIAGYPTNILVERPLYMEFDRPATTGQTPSGGTVISGSNPGGSIYAEGYTGAGFETWVAMTYFNDSDKWRDYWEDSLANREGNWLQAVCYFPGGREDTRHGVKNNELLATGYAGHWYTYMWHVNGDFPGTDISIRSEFDTYSERIMIFSYMGKWSGMHSSGYGCGW